MESEKVDGGEFDRRAGLDGSGFFVIHVDHERGRLVVEFYSYDRKLRDKIVGDNAMRICERVVEKGLISDLGHGMYLGRELAKAEIALRGGFRYKQDTPLSLS
ncbi:MAG: DUF4346 domain-containing protein [Candidatus Altiarchaeota archaeon]